jgi:transcriptional regulator with XRE-family HTH domain
MSPEAQEFVKLMRVMGWNQSETARQLRVTSSFVNQICNGKAEPSAAVLQLLRLTVANEKPGAVTAKYVKEVPARRGRPPIQPEWARNMIKELSRIEDPERAKLVQRLRHMIKDARSRR